MSERVDMGRVMEELGVFISLLVAFLGTVLADLSISTRNPIITYIWCGGILPAFLILSTIYLVATGKLPKDRIKAWAFISCGLLLMSSSGILTSSEDFDIATMGIILLITGFLIVIFTSLAFRVRNVNMSSSNEQVPETPKSFLKSCVACGRQIPIASEECPFCQAKQS